MLGDGDEAESFEFVVDAVGVTIVPWWLAFWMPRSTEQVVWNR